MKIKFILALIILITYFMSCDDFVEKDLKSQWVYGISPQDFSVINVQATTFKWQKVKGAESYNLQIYKTNSDYNTVKEFIVDTNVRGTQYIQTLRAGYYKWHIYAQNGSSQSGLSIFRFQIDSSSDITNQKILLLYPPDKKNSDSLIQVFRWAPVAAAKQYYFQIYESGNNTAVISKIVSTTDELFPFKKTGTYKWRVAALNGNISSPYTEFTLTIDTARPAIPVVLSPKNDTSINANPVVFKWNGVSAASTYRIEVAMDTTASLKDTTIITDSKASSATFYGTAVTRKYYWRIKAIKGATEGMYSRWWLFRRNQ